MFSKNAKASGEMARFLQLRIEKDDSLTKEQADNYFGRLFDNYGHAGEVYAQWIISNLDTVKTASGVSRAQRASATPFWCW